MCERCSLISDLEAPEDTPVCVSHFAMLIDGHLAELDINSIRVLPSGQCEKAVDALGVFQIEPKSSDTGLQATA
jgi:hypothetical protein